MLTTRFNGNFNGTIHHKGEPSEYYVEQSARRPHRQRVLAVLLVVVVAPLLVAYMVVDLPRPNAVATVVGTAPTPLQPGEPGRTPVPGTAPVDQTLVDVAGLRVSYVLDGREATVDLAVTDTDYDHALEVHPIGSTLKVHAYPADGPSGTPARAILPEDHTTTGGGWLAITLVGAALLWAAARRNEAKGPLSVPVYLDPR